MIYLLFFLPLNGLAVETEEIQGFFESGDYKKAYTEIKKTEKNKNLTVKELLLKYEVCKKINRIEEARTALNEAIKLDETCYEAYIGLCILAIEEGNSTDAKKYFKTAVDINPEIAQTPEILYYYAKICILDKDFNSALSNMLLAIEFEPDEKEYYLELGKIYLYQNKILKAINAFEYALGENSGLNGECYNYIGLANFKRGNYKTALENFERAVEISPEIIYLSNLALCYKVLDMENEYKETIQKLNLKKPSSPKEYLEMSQIYYSRGDIAFAKNILGEGLEKYPKNNLLINALKLLNKT
ncbi:MAG: tetratricopeptide repeat protein [Candidatus Gastranaerophilales bacterium]|nr:tetratricopeptide repeat protein [Candidatus Gastranaerophilales bacterium]